MNLRIFFGPAIVLAVAFLASAKKPNIVFIMADDLGYGDLGCYGQELIKTPHIDRLAENGMRFTDFYAGSTVCAPSRCVLMTGLDTGHCFIRGNGKNSLRPEDVTVAELLKEAGYATGQIGKWGLGGEGTTGTPNKKGFDFFYGYMDQTHAHLFYPTFVMKNDTRIALRNIVPNEGPYGQGVASVKIDYTPALMVDETLGFIDRHKDDPFFMYLSYTLPHANNEAWRETGDGTAVPDYGIYADKPWSKQDKGQAAMVSYLDDMVGKVVERLEQYGLIDDTIIFFTSDNGPHSEAGNDPTFFDANGPVSGIKRSMYDGGIRVPLIVQWPGKVEAGSVTERVTGQVDFLATAVDIAGEDLSVPTNGISFLPLLTGRESEQKDHDFLYWEFYEQGGKQAIRKGKYKALRRPMLTGPIEIYDLSADIAEERDLAKSNPELVSTFEKLFAQGHTPSDWKVRGQLGTRATERIEIRDR
ncbi:MAG: N-acetylgalactosamine-6-sulfatase [Opitutales bacterium TMED158]|nr:MAG: N-acetylgalactosamine-6-sulfatase [Opitutales bacterium TMED158]